jgi:uncharacterized protein YndB with AHSA1/START domain
MTARRRLTIERSYRASLEEVWALWTTKEGIESWWGPVGFAVTVRDMDLRAGGSLVYLMTATAPQQVAFMKQAGMPLSTEAKVSYIAVEPPRRLAYKTLTDFVPGVAPYDVETVMQLEAVDGEVRMVLTFDAMHDEVWTERARAGHESQLGKLDAVLAARR